MTHPVARLVASQGKDIVVQFAVALKNTDWTIFENGIIIARGMSRSRAIEAAERLAQEAARSGENVELVVQGYTGELISRQAT